MKNLAKLILLLGIALTLTKCKWLKNDPEPIDQLPPITQEGKNTFGCLLNRKVWIPKGFDGTSNYTVYYDPTNAQGILNISTYRYPNENSNKFQALAIYSDSLTSTGTYLFNKPGRQGVGYDDELTLCIYDYRDKNTYMRGSLTITRLDLQQGVVAGTFEFTLATPGCDTIKVTDGRFDKKL
jgi:hypothetical protein